MSLPRTCPLPKNFLDQACRRQTLHDEQYIHMREELQAAMRMPSEHRWVADWLFLDSNTCFHRNMLLPPEAFNSCFAVKVAQPPNPVQGAPLALPPDFLSLSPLMRLLYYPQISDVLFIPVAAIANILVGYCIVIKVGSTAEGDATTSFFSRFAFDVVRGDLTMILNLPSSVSGAGNGVTMVMGLGIDQDGTKRHRVFTCPLEEYNFECIPNRVLPKTYGATHNNPSQTSSTQLADAFSSGESCPEVEDEAPDSEWNTYPNKYPNPECSMNKKDIVTALQSPVSDEHRKIHVVDSDNPRKIIDASKRPWILKDNGSTADGVGIPRRPGKSSTAAGAFDMDTLKRCLDVLEETLKGDLFALDVRDDGCAGSTSIDISLQMGRADIFTESGLKDRILQSYYATNLAIPRNNHFSATYMPRGSAQSLHLDRAECHRAVPLAPREEGMVDWTKGEEGVSLGVAQLEMKALADRKEAQRRRNRLSAARSYEKRKRRKEMEEKRRIAAAKN